MIHFDPSWRYLEKCLYFDSPDIPGCLLDPPILDQINYDTLYTQRNSIITETFQSLRNGNGALHIYISCFETVVNFYVLLNRYMKQFWNSDSAVEVKPFYETFIV